MPGSSSSSRRSANGCWTCRLRHKKCDETVPFCACCESLEIQCFGYGPKPQWLDGGAQERQMAAEIKRAVRRGISERSRCNMTVSRFTLDQDIPLLAPVSKAKPTDFPVVSPDTPWVNKYSNYTLEPLATPPMTTPSPNHTRRWSSGPSPIDDLPGLYYSYSSPAEVHDDQMDSFSRREIEQKYTLSDSELSDPEMYSMTTRETDIMALYLDTVFYETYPFHRLRKSSLEYRDWHLALPIFQGPAQQACFGVRRQPGNELAASGGSSNSEYLEETSTGLQATSYYICAIESLGSELAHWIQNRGNKCPWERREKTTEILFCILQLIIFEVMIRSRLSRTVSWLANPQVQVYQDGDTSLWKTHFQGVSDLITDLPPWFSVPSSVPTSSSPTISECTTSLPNLPPSPPRGAKCQHKQYLLHPAVRPGRASTGESLPRRPPGDSQERRDPDGRRQHDKTDRARRRDPSTNPTKPLGLPDVHDILSSLAAATNHLAGVIRAKHDPLGNLRACHLDLPACSPVRTIASPPGDPHQYPGGVVSLQDALAAASAAERAEVAGGGFVLLGAGG
ncbi:hypothetical protein BP6252_13734 [Coleophoma cylindrospora]|uniref:Zn(2)-C6 fungal-type domain-containing protein n=1 Tax=Coleophoma cylindrospora TaxID=1849047 RepID=A0A3D8Q7R9_9HELO|nr:hypothetical protein BP6252_13734 [Coleophoma cylindrospora]